MARLGRGFHEPVAAFLDEALAFEDAEPRSLHGFLHRSETMRAEIKREVSEEGSGVRVMTVHGAKGLEAPAVYLADADYVQSATDHWRRETLIKVAFPTLKTELPLLLPQSIGEDCKATTAWREQGDEARLEEYRRLFYVAATRAEETLTLCGGKPDYRPESWYALASAAFDQLASSPQGTDEIERNGEMIQRYAFRGEMPTEEAEMELPLAAVEIPSWIDAPALEEAKDPVLYPSALSGEEWRPVTEEPMAAASRGDARARGLLVHKLLELLPDRERGAWPDIAATIASRFAFPVEERAALVADVLRLLEDPSVADLFAAGGLAEVSIQGLVNGKMISGQIDRLLLDGHEVIIE
ncbi:MAG: 3'-5' exonuclease, partial [Pseudomonadota bacterium]